MNPRQADAVAELTHNFLLLIIRADNRFAQNAEIIREFRFALVLVGIFPRHSDSDSQLGANRRRTKVNLGLDMNAPGMWFNADGELVRNEPSVFQIVPHALDLWLASDADENHR